MRHHDEGDAQRLLDFDQFELGFLAQLLVERAERFVEQQQFGALGQRARQGDALPLAARQLVRAALAVLLQFHEIEQFRHPVADFGAGQVVALQAIGDVLLHAHMREQRIGLEHHIDGAVVGRNVRHVLAVDFNGARGRAFETRQHAQQGRFARARSAEQAEELALVDVERHVGHGRDVTELLGDVADADEGLGRRIAPGTGIDGELRLLGHGVTRAE